MTRSIPLSTQVAVCTQLSQLLTAGFPLREALTIVGLNFPRFTAQWQTLDARLTGGSTLGDALAQIGFHPVIVDQLALAAVHGQLATTLTAASHFLTVQTSSRHQLRQLLLYPLMLLVLLVGLQIGLVVGVLPVLHAGTSRLLPLEAAVGLTVLAGAVVASWWLHHAAAPVKARWLLRLPGVSALARRYYQYQFVLGLAQYLAAGLTLADYVDRLSHLPSSALQATANSIQAQLATGVAVGDALKQPLVYPPVRALLLLGQPPALVAQGITVLATQLLQELQQAATRLLALVQPLLFLVIGGQIVLMYRELLLPLYGGLGG